ncbi:hypothetical protein AA0614_0034 [Komagataeibacter saccharivorans NRIC 0614]|nr:hypothetical protein AA0614_0034 [Komagataeibacter saccharivorans NRIC 0614]
MQARAAGNPFRASTGIRIGLDLRRGREGMLRDMQFRRPEHGIVRRLRGDWWQRCKGGRGGYGACGGMAARYIPARTRCGRGCATLMRGGCGMLGRAKGIKRAPAGRNLRMRGRGQTAQPACGDTKQGQPMQGTSEEGKG